MKKLILILSIILCFNSSAQITQTGSPGNVTVGDVTIDEGATVENGGDLPTTVKVVAGYDGADVRVLHTDSSGDLQVDVLSSALPSGAATEATLSGKATEATLSSLNSKVTAVNTGAVVVSSSALPTGAATEATLAALNAKVTAVNTGAVVVSSSALPTGAATAALQTKVPIAANASGSTSTVSTVVTLTAPADAIGFILMAMDTNTANVRWASGRTATTTVGQQLQPGRDTGYIPLGKDLTIVAESGTQGYDIQWISQ